MKIFVKCSGIEDAVYGGKIAIFSSEDMGVVLTVLTKEHPDEKFKVGHEYELMLTE